MAESKLRKKDERLSTIVDSDCSEASLSQRKTTRSHHPHPPQPFHFLPTKVTESNVIIISKCSGRYTKKNTTNTAGIDKRLKNECKSLISCSRIQRNISHIDTFPHAHERLHAKIIHIQPKKMHRRNVLCMRAAAWFPKRCKPLFALSNRIRTGQSDWII